MRLVHMLQSIMIILTTLLLAACNSLATPLPTSTPQSTITPIPPTLTPGEPTPIADDLTYEQAIHLFDYAPNAPAEVKQLSFEEGDGYILYDILYPAHSSDFGVVKGWTTAYLVQPVTDGPFAGVLFMHWLGNVNSNRKEFLEEAKLLAKQGVVSLMIDGYFPWTSRPTNGESDRMMVMRQVVEIRRALDFLLSQPGVDPQRVAYVGHDYGALYGGVLSGVDTRVKAYVLMTGMGNFSDWSLGYFLPTSVDETEYRIKMAVVEPILYIPHATPASLLFQFSENDQFITKEAANEFYEAANEPKEIKWYSAPHGLDEAAQQDRLAWLAEQLNLPPPN